MLKNRQRQADIRCRIFRVLPDRWAVQRTLKNRLLYNFEFFENLNQSDLLNGLALSHVRLFDLLKLGSTFGTN